MLFLAAPILALLLFSAPAHAFPEMVRHHYVNCNSCHASPSGGGLLNEYGRGMAAEILSTWSYENESLFFHGAIKPEKIPKAVNVGGDLRVLQVHREDRSVREGRFILMQSQVEAGLTAGPVMAVAAFGKPNRQNQIEPEFPRFYLLANATETLQVRAGRILPPFGLNVANHNVPTRQALGFGYDSERNTLEAHWNGEQWHGAFSASQARLRSRVGENERAASFQLERFFNDSHRVGFSTWSGESDRQKRWLGSLHGIFGFTERLYLLSEVVLQSKKSKAPRSEREEGIYHFGRFGFEITKGVHLLALEEFSKSNLKATRTQFVSFGAGALWYPRPHFELELTLNQRKNLQTSREFEDYAYLMLHYYL
jgi:hypothetical protein